MFESTLRRWIVHTAVPLTKFFSHIHSPWSHKLITSKHYYEMLKILKPGHVLLSYTKGEFGNLVIPGTFKHGALATGNSTLIEATGKGVTQSDLLDFALTKDRIAILEPLFADDVTRADAVTWASLQVGKPYDYEFGSGLKAFYCFELVGEAFQSAWEGRNLPEICPWQPKVTFGVPTYVGDDFIKATAKWRLLWSSEAL